MTSKDSARDGKWKTTGVFYYGIVDEDGTGNYFETDQAKTDTPTLYFGVDTDPHRIPITLRAGVINRIHYRLNPTAGETYTLRIWSHAIANDYHSNSHMLWESAAAQVDDTDYDHGELNIPFVLDTQARMYYSIDWTGAPGNTPGFIGVEGVFYE